LHFALRKERAWPFLWIMVRVELPLSRRWTMPKLMLCLSEVLRDFRGLFRPCFRRRQWQSFVTVLRGLLEQAAALKGLRTCVWKTVSLLGRARFRALWPWSPITVARTGQADFRPERSRRNSPGVGGDPRHPS